MFTTHDLLLLLNRIYMNSLVFDRFAVAIFYFLSFVLVFSAFSLFPSSYSFILSIVICQFIDQSTKPMWFTCNNLFHPVQLVAPIISFLPNQCVLLLDQHGKFKFKLHRGVIYQDINVVSILTIQRVKVQIPNEIDEQSLSYK